LWLCRAATNFAKLHAAPSISIRQLKAKVEVEGGLKAAALGIYLPEVAQPLG
jgi:hypothetical protein